MRRESTDILYVTATPFLCFCACFHLCSLSPCRTGTRGTGGAYDRARLLPGTGLIDDPAAASGALNPPLFISLQEHITLKTTLHNSALKSLGLHLLTTLCLL